MSLPIEVGEKVREYVVDISHEGKGVIKVDNFTVFTDEGIIGDKVEVEIEDIRRNFAIGKTIDIIKESDKRVEPKCSLANICGGCQLQELDYEEQLKFKRDKVINDLERIGKIEDVEVLETIGMDDPYRYRNNVQIPVSYRDGDIVIGHYEKGTHRVVDTEICYIQEEVADRVVRVVRDYMRKNNVRTYNRRQNRGLVKHLVIRTAYETKDTMVVLVINGDKIPNEKELIDNLKSEIPEFKSLVLNINRGRSKSTMSGKSKAIYGENKLIDKIGGLEFEISAESFFQVNTKQAEVLYDKVVEFADFKKDDVVVDLYSGTGAIALYIADKVSHVYGVEIFKSAVEDAKRNAEINNIENASFFEGSAEEILPQLEQGGTKANVLVVDPPRKGCEEELLDAILEIKPERVIYVSCNPATLARDLKYLGYNNYRAEKIQPVDLFGHTTHVESVTLIKRVDME